MGTLQNIMAQDLTNVFYNTNDFAVPCNYTPQGGVVKNNIPIIVDEAVTRSFHHGKPLFYRTRQARVRSSDIATISVVAVDGGVGDSLVLVADSSTWFVVDQIDEGGQGSTGEHVLLLADKKIAVTRG